MFTLIENAVAARQPEGIIGLILHLLGLDLGVRDHSTLSGRAEALGTHRQLTTLPSITPIVQGCAFARTWRLAGRKAWHPRRSRRKLQIGIDGDTVPILASKLTRSDVYDGRWPQGALASFIGDGADG